jgi:ABC-type amino acid transport substrate-binding protein
MNDMTSLASSALLVALALCFTPAQAVEAPPAGAMPELVACLSDDNLPFSASSSAGGGIDAEVSRGIGAFLHRAVRISWVTVPARGGLGKALRQSMKPGNCDLFLGIPVSGPSNEDVLEQQLETSGPYIASGYVLVAAKGSRVRTLEDARKAARVGVVTATPADIFLHKKHFNRVPYGSNNDLLNALSSGAVDAGVLWLPALANAEQKGFELWPEAVRSDRLDSPGLETQFVIAMRRNEPDLKAGINAALAHMRSDGSLASILQRHRIGPALAQ